MGATYLSKRGFEKLQAEQGLLLKQKHKLTEEVSKAAAMGDLRENAEYHAARERLQHVAQRLGEIDGKLADVRITDELQTKAGEARVGTKVTLEDEQAKDRFSYILVGADEADPANGQLSIESPIGKGLLGKKKGDRFTVTLPKGVASYKVIKVERTSDA